MKRILTPDDQKAGHEAAKRREAGEAEARGWKPGAPPFVSQALAMDLRQEQAETVQKAQGLGGFSPNGEDA